VLLVEYEERKGERRNVVEGRVEKRKDLFPEIGTELLVFGRAKFMRCDTNIVLNRELRKQFRPTLRLGMR
jgi:hypothetical protein